MEAFVLQTGAVLGGKWKIGGLLGHGGMATVYSASHVRNGGSVAVKVLRPILSSDASLRSRFLQEGYTANQVGHPGTVRVLDDDTTSDGWAFLVMERLEGETVDQICERNGNVMPLDEVAFVIEAVLDVMSAAHEKGIVHRDLKPENWFITTDNQVKVLDFGIARMRQSEENARITATGVPMGTPAFMPPEQALAHWDEVDAQSDIYAVGASIWSMLTGQVVHRGRTPAEVLVMVATRRAPPLRSVAPHVPEAIAEIVDRSLIFERHARFADAREMQRAFRVAVKSLGIRATCPQASRTVVSQRAPRMLGETAAPVATIGTTAGRNNHLWRWAAIGAILSLLVGGGAVFLMSRNIHSQAGVDATAAPEVVPVPAETSPAAEPPIPIPTAVPSSTDELVASSAPVASASAAPSAATRPVRNLPRPLGGKPKPTVDANSKPSSGGTLDRYK